MGGRTRKWEVFPGRSRFPCGGRCVSGGRCGALGVTLGLLLGTAALHFAFTAPFLARAVSPWVPAAGGALAAVTLAALLRTALSDPGVLPRASPSELAAAPVASRPPPRAREVLVRGRLVKLKYCFTCKVFRPPRASHCSLCDNCVERFDHHCPWVGNCVGRRNYRHFYQFVVSLSFLCVWVMACGCAHVGLTARSAGGLGAALRQEPGSALAAAVAFLAVWSVLGLAGFHTYLAATEQTTNEDIKGAWSGGRSPYSRGSACANYWHVLCAPVPPSLIDSRGFVSPDGLDEDLPPAFRAALQSDLAAAAAAANSLSFPPPSCPLPPEDPPTSAASIPSPQTPYLISAPSYSMSGSPYAVRSPVVGPRPRDVTTRQSPPRAVTWQPAVTALSPHAYMNHSLDLDSLPLQEVCVSPRDDTARGNGHVTSPPALTPTNNDNTKVRGAGVSAGVSVGVGVSAGVGVGVSAVESVSVGGAAWRRTTMIDAALDLDDLPALTSLTATPTPTPTPTPTR